MKKLAIGLSLLCLYASLLSAGQPAQGRQLSPQETDRAIDTVFNGAQGVVRMEAELITQKTGGMVKGSQTAYEFLRLEAPSRMVLINRGPRQGQVPLENSSLVIADGRNIWEVEAREQNSRQRSVSRRAFRPNLTGARAQGLAVFIGLFLMGRDVTSASGLREDFNIACYDEPIQGRRERTLHFILTPKKPGETVELWMLPNETLPWKVRSFERKVIKFPPPKPGEAPRYKLEESVRTLRNVRTNLTGLPPFRPEIFLLPLAQDMVIRDEQTNQVLTLDQVRRELEEVRREYMAGAGRR